MQDVFLTVLTKGSSFEGKSSLVTWLYAITTNLCLNRLRNLKRRVELQKGFDPLFFHPAGPDPELLRLVHNQLAALPEEQAQAVVYYYFDEMTHDEIARVMGCSRRKVGYLLDKAQQSLQERGDTHD
jgi:RNA polymerase sigma factor (sigma-70 family)